MYCTYIYCIFFVCMYIKLYKYIILLLAEFSKPYISTESSPHCPHFKLSTSSACAAWNWLRALLEALRPHTLWVGPGSEAISWSAWWSAWCPTGTKKWRSHQSLEPQLPGEGLEKKTHVLWWVEPVQRVPWNPPVIWVFYLGWKLHNV